MLPTNQPLLQSSIKNSIPYSTKTFHKNSPPFNSKSERFQDMTKSYSPGPCAYEYHPIKNNFHRNTNQQDLGIKKQYQWIFTDNQRMPYLPSHVNKLGPGAYQTTILKNNSHSSWNKSNRFKPNQNTTHSVGPGTYHSDIAMQPKPTLSAPFKSKVPKTFMQIIQRQTSKTNIQITQPFDNPQEQKIKQNIKKKIKQKKQLSSFASKIQRFQKIKKQLVGPGSYQVNIQKIPKDKLPKIITVHQNYRHQVPKKPQKPSPGPGQYDYKINTIQHHLQHKGTMALISKQQRFPDQNHSKSPGPGHYMKNKFVFIKENEPKNPNAVGSFLATSERSSPFSQGDKNPFGNYNVQIFNLDYKAKKKRQHLQKLKIMEVQLAPFDTKQKR